MKPLGLMLVSCLLWAVAMLPASAQPLLPGLVSWWPAEGDARDLVGTNHGTLYGGTAFASGKVGQSFSFDGVNDCVSNTTPSLVNVKDTFTIVFWASPTASRPTTPETTSGISGEYNQRYAIFPEIGLSAEAGVGVSVGTNGISVFEHAGNYVPSLLVYDAPMSGWTHVAVVYENKRSKLFVNAILVRTGLASPRSFVFPSKQFGGFWNHYMWSYYGPYRGLLDEIGIFNRALTAQEIELVYWGMGATIDSPTRSCQILASDTLRFSGHATLPPNLGPPTYFWDFGDGRSSTLQTPGFVNFAIPGTNIVTFDVIDNQGYHVPTPATRIITVIEVTNAIPDLAVTQLNVPGNLAIGQPAQITYTVRNAGAGALSGKSWKDALYLSRDAYLDVNDRLLISATVSNNVAIGGAYTNTLTVTLPTVEEGAYYLLLSVNDEWQVLERHRLNNEFAVVTDLVIPRLTNAVPFAGAFTGNGDEQYFRIDVPAGQNLLIRFNDADQQGANGLYVRFGALPTRGTFDFCSTLPGQVNQQVLIPAAAPGAYYILVRGDSVPGSGNFTI